MIVYRWQELLFIVGIGTLTYAGVIALLRISGSRTLAKLNAFDLVVTVAIGSILATTLLSKDVPLLEGLTAIAVLIGLQFLIAIGSRRFKLVERLAKSEPSVLLRDGKIDEAALERQRVTRNEVLQAIRSSGIGDVERVAAVVLETNGKLSVIGADKFGSGSAMKPMAEGRGREQT